MGRTNGKLNCFPSSEERAVSWTIFENIGIKQSVVGQKSGASNRLQPSADRTVETGKRQKIGPDWKAEKREK
jgi:hypothetical protein